MSQYNDVIYRAWNEKQTVEVEWSASSFRVIRCASFDRPSKPYYIVRESVGAYYIDWEDKYGTLESAKAAILALYPNSTDTQEQVQ